MVTIKFRVEKRTTASSLELAVLEWESPVPTPQTQDASSPDSTSLTTQTLLDTPSQIWGQNDPQRLDHVLNTTLSAPTLPHSPAPGDILQIEDTLVITSILIGVYSTHITKGAVDTDSVPTHFY